jgi:hypothetical protein
MLFCAHPKLILGAKVVIIVGNKSMM